MCRKLFSLCLPLFAAACCCLPQKSSNPGSNSNWSQANISEQAVLLQIINKELDPVMVATGFAFHRDYILTAGHFCAIVEKTCGDANTDANKPMLLRLAHVGAAGRLRFVSDLELVRYANTAEIDLCVLRKKDHGVVVTAFRHADNIRVGEAVIAIGAPHGHFPVWASGNFVGNLSGDICVVSTNSASGSSGSPVFDLDKRVIAMVVMTDMRYHHLSLGIRLNTLKFFVSDLILE